jgi:hypothetical protein
MPINNQSTQGFEETGGNDFTLYVPRSVQMGPTGTAIKTEQPTGGLPAKKTAEFPWAKVGGGILGVVGLLVAAVSIYVGLFQQPLADVKANVKILEDANSSTANDIDGIKKNIERMDENIEQISESIGVMKPATQKNN